MERSTRAEVKARLAQRGVRVIAGDGGFYVMVACGVDRDEADRVAEAAFVARGEAFDGR